MVSPRRPSGRSKIGGKSLLPVTPAAHPVEAHRSDPDGRVIKHDVPPASRPPRPRADRARSAPQPPGRS
jgi:hypothetical protein